MAPIPVITGIGLVTPLGRSASSTFDALLAGRFVSNHTRLDSNVSPTIPRIVSLATEAADEAVAQASWYTDQQEIGIVACTSKGSIEKWIASPESCFSGPCEFPSNSDSADIQTPNPRARAPYHPDAFGLSDLSAHLAHHIGSTAPRLCLSSACCSGLHGLIRAAMMIRSGQARRVLVVAAEASVHPLFLASFNRLGVLPPAGGVCRPFDLNRNGFLMSEAAAAVCLEAAADHNRSRALAVVDRFALGGDAAHLTGMDPNATVLKYLLNRVIIDQRIDLIHAHGTGTIANDSTELSALESMFTLDPARSLSWIQHPALITECSAASGFCSEQGASRRPHLYSHKAALGHTLGASGLVAVVINCLCHRYGVIPGNINTASPLPTTAFNLDAGSARRPVQRSLIHAAGFGGPIAVVTLDNPTI